MHTRKWDATGMASGVHFHRLQMEGFVSTKVLALRYLAFLLTGLVGIIALYVAFNWPRGVTFKSISAQEMTAYLSYLDQNESDPARFISNQFRHHDIILIGEFHKRKQDVDFVRSLIPYLYTNCGVTVIGWEFGASELQEEVDSLLSANTYDEKRTMSILRRTMYSWNYREYLEFFRVIWEFNHSLPGNAERIQFLQLGSIFNERKLQSDDWTIRSEEARRYSYDKKMAEIMEREVLLKGKKALWYSGLHHAFTKYHQPIMFFLKNTGENARGGNFLYAKYPERLYLVVLHSQVPSRLFVPTGGFSRDYYPWGAVFDRIYDVRPRPYGLDVVTSPFAYAEDNYSWYSIDHLGPIWLKDFCDGYVVLCSFKQIEPVRTIDSWISDAADSAEVFSTLSAERLNRVKTVKELMDMMNEDPIKSVRRLNSLDTTGYAQNPVDKIER